MPLEKPAHAVSPTDSQTMSTSDSKSIPHLLELSRAQARLHEHSAGFSLGAMNVATLFSRDGAEPPAILVGALASIEEEVPQVHSTQKIVSQFLLLKIFPVFPTGKHPQIQQRTKPAPLFQLAPFVPLDVRRLRDLREDHNSLRTADL